MRSIRTRGSMEGTAQWWAIRLEPEGELTAWEFDSSTFLHFGPLCLMGKGNHPFKVMAPVRVWYGLPSS